MSAALVAGQGVGEQTGQGGEGEGDVPTLMDKSDWTDLMTLLAADVASPGSRRPTRAGPVTRKLCDRGGAVKLYLGRPGGRAATRREFDVPRSFH